jgi:hypothetical protein
VFTIPYFIQIRSLGSHHPSIQPALLKTMQVEAILHTLIGPGDVSDSILAKVKVREFKTNAQENVLPGELADLDEAGDAKTEKLCEGLSAKDLAIVESEGVDKATEESEEEDEGTDHEEEGALPPDVAARLHAKLLGYDPLAKIEKHLKRVCIVDLPAEAGKSPIIRASLPDGNKFPRNGSQHLKLSYMPADFVVKGGTRRTLELARAEIAAAVQEWEAECAKAAVLVKPAKRLKQG